MSLTDKVFAAEGRWLMGKVAPRKLLDSIGSHLRAVAPGREEELVAAIGSRAEELAKGDQDMLVDGPAKGMLATCSVVLAGYEILLPEFDGDERRTILFLQHIFGEAYRRSIEVVIEALTKGDTPLDTVAKAMEKSSAMYGSYFRFDFERPDDDTFEMGVTRCFFHDFFARHDAPLVTTVLCAWDANWMQALDPGVTGLRSERTSLLSLGDDACRFRVVRTDDPLAAQEDVLAERFAGPAQGG
ncbi:MAG: hypothetical protein GEU88_13595 [Solirubrobacterales bacterium]|nr:hypothetical protein [Solirubrobacterales bacterium]